jgi:hypothetical protein
LCKFRLSLSAIFFSLLCGLVRPLLLSGGLLAGKLRLGLGVLLGLLGQVTLLSGRLCVRSRLRSLLSQHLGLVLGTLEQLAESFRLLAELGYLALQATDRS